jgi:hypothetical protein
MDFVIESLKFFKKYWKGKGHQLIIFLRWFIEFHAPLIS